MAEPNPNQDIKATEAGCLYWITRSHKNQDPRCVTLDISTVAPLSTEFYDKLQTLIMEDRNRNKLEVKAPFEMKKVIETVDNEVFESEIAAHLFSYYIGEI